MEKEVQRALEQDTLIDITTRGRKTGQAHRIEIWLHYLDDRVILAGAPGRRGWYANMLANPEFTIHLKQSVQRDVAARATAVTDVARRREVFQRLMDKEERMRHASLEERVARSALVEVEVTA